MIVQNKEGGPGKAQQQRAFIKLKEALTIAPILSLPREDSELFLYTDASDIGFGCELIQKTPDGGQTTIAYGSRVLQQAERNYTTTEKECLAVVWVCGKFKTLFLSHLRL